MLYTETCYLSPQQQVAVRNLHKLCQTAAEYMIPRFMENDYNINPSMPCFYLCGEREQLIGFLSIFLPNPQEAEISAFIHPAYRRQGIFSHLWELAMRTLEQYQVETIYVPLAVQNRIARQLLTDMDFRLGYSEYTMTYQHLPHTVVGHQLPSRLSFEQTKTGYKLWLDKTIIGTCAIDIGNYNCTIYSLEIFPAYRQQGYGSLFLEQILLSLETEYPTYTILLQVNGENTVAFNMYLRHNFQIQQQLDYWVY